MRGRGLILVTLCLAALIINLDTTIVNVALPALVRQIGATTTGLQWVVDAYNLTFAALILAAGSLSDRLGRKGMLLAGLAVFGAASLAGSYAATTGQLIAARAVMGLGAAMIAYSPLSTGVRLLPVAVTVGVAAVAGTRLAVRIGNKIIVGGGMLFFSAALAWIAAFSRATSYGVIAASMVVLGIGMGFTQAPATEAIMGAVPKEKAGIASAVNGSTRLFGGTLGVAVIGSVAASLYTTRLTALLPAGLPARAITAAQGSVGGAAAAAGQLARAGLPGPARALNDAAVLAFMHSLTGACLVAAGVAAAGVLLVAFLLPNRPRVQETKAQPASGIRPQTAGGQAGTHHPGA